ncbi:MAG: class I SAM-dependent methyltransferase [Candidatus Sericytochromatia bacterium]
MDIKLSNACNVLSLKLLAEYYSVSYSELEIYYNELLEDSLFLNELNNKINEARPYYSKGLFSHAKIDSVDWFANQRIVLYVLVRLLKPYNIVETGVFYGGTTAFILNAIHKNNFGRLVSIDLPANNIDAERHEYVGNSEYIPKELKTGFIIPEYLKSNWELIEGDSLDILSKMKDEISFFSHDSEHSKDFLLKELTLAKERMKPNSTIFVDDIDWSNGFIEFCVINKLHPLFLTDNGKSELKVRLGVIRNDHPNNNKKDITA